MEQALKLIITKSPAVARQAIQTLAAIAAKSPMVQVRYNHTVQAALADPQAEFTAADRALIADALEMTGEAGRDYILHIRLTDSERGALQEEADAAGQSLSEYARQKMFK